MVAPACERLMDLHSFTNLHSRYLGKSGRTVWEDMDQALVINFGKKYFINNTNKILIMLMLEPL